MNIKYFILLLLVALVSACNEEGIATLVIEDGQPSVAKMIVGQWKPNHAEKADEDGNIIEDLDITDIPDLNFGENGSGHFGNNGTGTGGSDSGNFDWSVDEGENTGGDGGYDEKGPSVIFNGERWYIFQLTKSKLIIYRVTDKYILIYYYYRVGDYNIGEDPEPTPIEKIYRITETTSYGDEIKNSAVHIFEYDKQGRIKTYSFDNGKSAFNSDYTYKGVEEVHVSGGGESYIGHLSNNQLEKLFSITATSSEQKLVAVPQYNDEGYISSINNIQFTYHANNLIKNGEYTYEYTDKKNSSNIDLNCIISSYSNYEHQYSHYSLFAPFGFYGKFSNNLISKESLINEGADVFYEYAYEIDSEDKVKTITRKCIDKRNVGNILNTTIFEVFYQQQ